MPCVGLVAHQPARSCEMSACMSAAAARILSASGQSVGLVSRPAVQSVKRPGRRSCEHDILWPSFLTSPHRRRYTSNGPFAARDPAVERARLVILRRSHVRSCYWANSLLACHQIANTFISLAKLGGSVCLVCVSPSEFQLLGLMIPRLLPRLSSCVSIMSIFESLPDPPG